MRQRVNSNIERQLLSVIRPDAFAIVALVVHAEGAAQAILAQNPHEVALKEKSFQLDVPALVQAANATDGVERTIDG